MSGGWDESAQAWIAGIGAQGDWSRRFVLDEPMLTRVADCRFVSGLDVGCGEGRFCRMMQRQGIRTVGVDATNALIARARQLDPGGEYHVGRAEALQFPAAAFDLAVSYLSLIDIADFRAAIAEVRRVLQPGGTFLIANLQSFNTAGPPTGWTREADGSRRFYIDDYFEERAPWVEWSGIRIQNWHRPLGAYMETLLKLGFELRHFSEPEPVGAEQEKADHYRRVPWFLIMEWRKAV